jgi:hypothetical protein
MREGRVAAASIVMLLLTAVVGFPCGTSEPTPAAERVKSDPIWILGVNLQKSPTENELAFTVTIDEPGAYEAVLEAQGSIAQDYVLNLVVQLETGSASQQARFSFAGLDCG